MKVNNLRIKNIASFRDFYSDAEFAKTTLFFGTNGSGKSTIASLLQLIDRYFSNRQSVEQLEEIREYISSKTSKEAANDENSIEIEFSDNSLKVSYDRFTDSVIFTGNEWYPIKVFNDTYTERTIGKVVDINLEDSGLIDFLGLSEYRIANDKKLLLKLNKDYDISEEGGRISSSQKKLLSMCYFIAEIISEIKTPSELKKYILIFDDPVDSADFIYFHSITAFIENMELVLKKILNTKILKFGQIMVMTHNSLLHDRLSKSFQFRRSITRIENISIFSPSEKTMNNYKIYLQYSIRYYKNPKKNRKDMIFIGTLIRRVLEILSNFNNLDKNDFNQYILDIGKPKLALLANHLSHESFTKVLNPFNSEIELRDACEELLDVIKQSHPIQFEYIQNEMLKDIEV